MCMIKYSLEELISPEAETSDNFDWGKPAESQPRSKPDWISEVRWPALVKFQMTEVTASGLCPSVQSVVSVLD